MLIYDEEIRERAGADADSFIADLDAEHGTQKGLATYPKEARYRPAVERHFELRAARDA